MKLSDVLDVIRQYAHERQWCSEAEYVITVLTGVQFKEWEVFCSREPCYPRLSAEQLARRFTPVDGTPEDISVPKLRKACEKAWYRVGTPDLYRIFPLIMKIEELIEKEKV